MSSINRQELVAYIYNETNELVSASIESALQLDPEVKAEYDAIIKVKEELSQSMHAPSQKTIEKIMLYARLNCCPQ